MGGHSLESIGGRVADFVTAAVADAAVAVAVVAAAVASLLRQYLKVLNNILVQ